MKIQEIKPIVELLETLKPTEQRIPCSIERLEEIKKNSNDRIGEFCTNLRPSDVILIVRMKSNLSARIQQAELFGQDEI